jgi:hypothetical protein
VKLKKKKPGPKKGSKRKPKEALKSNPNPNHKEDFDKVLEMLVPRIEPKAKK